MSRYKVLTFIALITLAFGIALISDALAGEKVKGRNSKYVVKWEQIEVPGEEGRVYALYDQRAIVTNLEGKAFLNGWPMTEMGFLDMSTKTGQGFGHGFYAMTDKDGDNIHGSWEGKLRNGKWEDGTWSYTRGTGKWEGIRGSGTWQYYSLSATQSYADWEGEVDLPR